MDTQRESGGVARAQVCERHNLSGPHLVPQILAEPRGSVGLGGGWHEDVLYLCLQVLLRLHRHTLPEALREKRISFWGQWSYPLGHLFFVIVQVRKMYTLQVDPALWGKVWERCGAGPTLHRITTVCA